MRKIKVGELKINPRTLLLPRKECALLQVLRALYLELILDSNCIFWLVSSLGVANSGWNVELIREIFISHDAKNIVKLCPLSFDSVDKLLWHPSRSDKFSVML